MPVRFLAAALLHFLALYPSVFAGDGSWVDKKVILKEAKVKIGFKTETGGDKSVSELSELTYTVLDDRDGFLKVRDRAKTAWFPKRKAVLAEDAVDYFTDSITQKPDAADLYKRRAAAWELRGELDAAVKDLDEAIRLDPKGHTYRNNRGLLYFQQGEIDRALKDFDEEIRLRPAYARAYNNRAAVYNQAGQPDKAIKDYDEAIRLQPDDALAYAGRGIVLFTKKDYQRAQADYEAAIRCDPEYLLAYNNLADALACCADAKFRDGAKAVELARTACRLSKWKQGVCLDTLACACAEAGQFDEAVKWQKKALDDPEYEKTYGNKGRMLLQRFEARQAYHYSADE
jgi:tetratricopeptide (TPR) repeat protein